MIASENTTTQVANPRHNSKTDQWFTPDEVLYAVQSTLGVIEVDMASSPRANERVRAQFWHGEQKDGSFRDGLVNPVGTPTSPRAVFCNPPGGKKGNKSLAKLFWEHLLDEVRYQRVSHAVFLFFSMEAAQTTQLDCRASILDYPCCWPKRRLSFVNGEGQKVSGNTHGSVIVYVPGTIDLRGKFYTYFSDIGKVTEPCRGAEPVVPGSVRLGDPEGCLFSGSQLRLKHDQLQRRKQTDPGTTNR